MDRIRVVGGVSLKGRVPIFGAKNATLPLMAACLLTDQPLVLNHVPQLADVRTMQELLAQHGVVCNSSSDTHQLILNAQTITSTTAPYDIVRKMRASFLVLGPLLARFGEACVSLPGGCALGTRAVDLHIKGLEALGAQIRLENGYIHAQAPQGLKGTTFHFPLVTVMGTENVMMAAVLAHGTTTLVNVAREPEVVDLAHCLQKMGAQIHGIGSSTLTIHGVASLKGCEHTVIPDRLEAGSYAVAAAMTQGDLVLEAAGLPDLLGSFLQTLTQMGVQVGPLPEGLHIKHQGPLRSAHIVTAPFPEFPTDLQPLLMALLTQGEGRSSIKETIFENRFMCAPELVRMGAAIAVHEHEAHIDGPTPLKGAPVMASDLRAAMSLVVAGLAAQGETIISRVYHLDRGYEKVEEKLTACGAVIERLKEAA